MPIPFATTGNYTAGFLKVALTNHLAIRFTFLVLACLTLPSNAAVADRDDYFACHGNCLLGQVQCSERLKAAGLLTEDCRDGLPGCMEACDAEYPQCVADKRTCDTECSKYASHCKISAEDDVSSEEKFKQWTNCLKESGVYMCETRCNSRFLLCLDQS